MTCREFVEFLVDYLDGDLPTNRRHGFEQHLAACPPCGDYLKTYEQSVKLGAAVCVCWEDDHSSNQAPEDLVETILAAWRRDH